jgi:hypothetical protein
MCVISGFRRAADETRAPLGYYPTSSGNFLPPFPDNLSVPLWLFKMGLIGCPETSAVNYHYSLHNNPEQRSSHLTLWWFPDFEKLVNSCNRQLKIIILNLRLLRIKTFHFVRLCVAEWENNYWLINNLNWYRRELCRITWYIRPIPEWPGLITIQLGSSQLTHDVAKTWTWLLPEHKSDVNKQKPWTNYAKTHWDI